MRLTNTDLWNITQLYKNELVITSATDTSAVTPIGTYETKDIYVFSGIGNPAIKRFIYTPNGSVPVSPLEIDAHILFKHIYDNIVISATPEVYVSATSAQPYLTNVRKGDFLISPTEGQTYIALNNNNLTLSGDWQPIISGVNASVPLTKITSGGTDGTLTVVNGLIIGYTAPT